MARSAYFGKLEYASLIAETLSHLAPSERDLEALMRWEVQAAAVLTETELKRSLQYGQRTMTVAEVLSLNTRHSVWHAGQLAALLAR